MQLVYRVKTVRPLNDVESAIPGSALILRLAIVIEVHALHELHVLSLLQLIRVELAIVLQVICRELVVVLKQRRDLQMVVAAV